MTSNILLIGDPHFKVSNKVETSQLSEETVKFIKENRRRIDFVIIMGDVLDTHEKIHVQPLCRAVEFIKKISELILVYVLIGNHDRINNNIFLSEDHPFTGLKRFENIIIVDKVLKKDNFIFVPYVPNGRFLEALETVDFEQESTEAIFAHQEFKGCKMGAFISETGDTWPCDFPTVFSGHIHEYQEPQKNILYTGTPFQHGFSDSADKFLVLLNFKTRDSWEIEKVYLNIIKKKAITMNITDLEDYKIPENVILKITLLGDSKTANMILSKPCIREKLKNHNIRYKLKNPEIKLKERSVKNSKNTFLENLESRIEKSNIDIKKIFKEIF